MKDYNYYINKKNSYIKKFNLFSLLTILSIIFILLFDISFYLSFFGFLSFWVFMPLCAYNSRKKQEYIKIIDYIDLQRVANGSNNTSINDNK